MANNPEPVDSHRYAAMTRQELHDASRDARVVVVPVGSCEQHSPALALETDIVGAVGLAAVQPAVVLFDEPISALDPEFGFEVLEVMAELAAGGMTRWSSPTRHDLQRTWVPTSCSWTTVPSVTKGCPTGCSAPRAVTVSLRSSVGWAASLNCDRCS